MVVVGGDSVVIVGGGGGDEGGGVAWCCRAVFFSIILIFVSCHQICHMSGNLRPKPEIPLDVVFSQIKLQPKASFLRIFSHALPLWTFQYKQMKAI